MVAMPPHLSLRQKQANWVWGKIRARGAELIKCVSYRHKKAESRWTKLSRTNRQDWVSPATFQLTTCRSRQARRWLRVTRGVGDGAASSWVVPRVLHCRVVAAGGAEVTSFAGASLEVAAVEAAETAP